MPKQIGVFGGSFNPPGLHHLASVEELRKHFDEVIVVPCGPRPDKETVNDIDPVHRATMIDLTFRGLPNVRVDLFDLEGQSFTRTCDLQKRYERDGEIWHAVGTDLIQGGAERKSLIHREWSHGSEIWRNLNFAIMMRSGHECKPEDFPPRNQQFNVSVQDSSSNIREMAFRRRSLKGHVTSGVQEYIERHNLYRGTPLSGSCRFCLKNPTLRIQTSDKGKVAADLFDYFLSKYHVLEAHEEGKADLIVVLGGDGAMLHAIRNYWRDRIPFFGINLGHRGFLLNQMREHQEDNCFTDLRLRQLPLLYVEVVVKGGRVQRGLAFNDAWLERSTGQTAWIETTVNGQIQQPRLIGDGILVATAAGSTAYARAMGAIPLPPDVPVLTVVGSNVLEPPAWKSAHLPLESVIEFRVLDPEKRPMNAYLDGELIENALKMKVRKSNIASAEVAFLPDEDMVEKLGAIQFPKI